MNTNTVHRIRTRIARSIIEAENPADLMDRDSALFLWLADKPAAELAQIADEVGATPAKVKAGTVARIIEASLAKAKAAAVAPGAVLIDGMEPVTARQRQILQKRRSQMAEEQTIPARWTDLDEVMRTARFDGEAPVEATTMVAAISVPDGPGRMLWVVAQFEKAADSIMLQSGDIVTPWEAVAFLRVGERHDAISLVSAFVRARHDDDDEGDPTEPEVWEDEDETAPF